MKRTIEKDTDQMTLIVFEDTYYTFDPHQDQVKPFSILDLKHYANELSNSRVIVNTPFQIVPELMYEDGMLPLILEMSNPYLTANIDRYRVDTWRHTYIKCAYYIPNALHQLNGASFRHWMSCLASYNEDFFNKHPTAFWVYRLHDTLHLFLKIEGKLQAAKMIKAVSPDDSSYIILKILEPYTAALDKMTLWTNESDPFHLQILYKFIASVKVAQTEPMKLLHQIVQQSCAL